MEMPCSSYADVRVILEWDQTNNRNQWITMPEYNPLSKGFPFGLKPHPV